MMKKGMHTCKITLSLCLVVLMVVLHAFFADIQAEKDNIIASSRNNPLQSEKQVKKLENLKLVEAEITASLRGGTERSRTAGSRKFGRLLSFIVSGIVGIRPSVSAVFIPSIISKSDSTPRYSIIGYLHRSDGKKSNLASFFI